MSIDVNVQNDLVIVTESSEDITVNVSNAQGPAGVGVPTGGSAGEVLKKLSGTDYDTYWALDAGGVPYSGATGDVDLGEYELKAGQVEFDQTPTGTAGVGVMRWNDSDGTVDLGLKGGNVTLQVGQEQVLRVVNKTGDDLLESQYRAVRIRLVSEGGSQGQRLAVVLAQGDNDPDSTTTIGIVTETIANNQEGFITTSGEVRGINTTGSLQGETWLDGDIIYLSPTVSGGITKVKPTAPDHMVVLGYVIYAHANNGKIFVKVDNGYELGELHDVYVPSPSNNDVIFWNTANSRYQNNRITGVLGYTPVPTTRTITINGTTLDLSADRTYTVSASATPAGANTQIQYNNSGVFGASAGLVYNDSTGAMTLSKNQNAVTSINISNNTSGTASQPLLQITSNSGIAYIGKRSSTFTASGIINGADMFIQNTTTGDIAIKNDFGGIKFAMGDSSVAHLTLNSSGRFLLGTTTDNATYLLNVNGASLFQDNLLVSRNFAGTTSINISNTTNTSNANPSLILTADTGGGSAQVFKYCSGRSAYKTLAASDFGHYNATAGDISFLNDVASGKIKFTAGGVSTAQMTLTAAGRLLLGTVSESTYLLDVNGSARVTSLRMLWTGGGKMGWDFDGTGAYFYGLEQGSTGRGLNIISKGNDGDNSIYFLTGSTPTLALSISANQLVTIGTSTPKSTQIMAVNGLLTFNTPTTSPGGTAFNINGFFGKVSFNGTSFNDIEFAQADGFITQLGTSKNINFRTTSGGTTTKLQIAYSGSVQIGSNTTEVSSSILTLESGIKGFLPPRMTTTQKNAIGTPAAGLQVYDTTLNQMSYYNGTTWVNF